MQINHLSQSVYTYIDSHLPPAIGYQCYVSFHLAEQMGLKAYEESFVSLISVDEDVEKDEVRDVFLEKVSRLLSEIVESHAVRIDPDSNPSLDDLIELVRFLDLVQRLEDMDPIAGRLSNEFDTPRKIFIDLLCSLTSLEVWRAMELISGVDEKLILAMRQMVKDRSSEAPQSPDYPHQREIQIFNIFVHGAECLGLKLLESGYRRLDWETLEALTSLNWAQHFTTQAQESVAQCALDFISVAMLCKDTYQSPSESLQKKFAQYLEDGDLITKVYAAVSQILTDYQTFKQAWLQQQQLNSES